MKNTLEHIPAVIAFIALVMGMSTKPKWDATQTGLNRVTQFGWATAGLGVTALCASGMLTRIRQRELDRQTTQRNQLRRTAHAEIRLALSQVTWPFFSLFGDDSKEAEFQLVPEHIEEASRMASVMRIEVRSKTPGLSGYAFDVPWAEVLKENAERGTERIDRAMQIYADYVEPEVLEGLSELRTSEFLWRLRTLDEHVNTNTRVAFLEFPFPNPPGATNQMEFGFRQFWAFIRSLDALLQKDPDRLRRRM
jgi:hypothetical protein